MPIKEMIEKCLNIAEMDCFTEDQFKFREFMYDVAAFLKKYDKEPEHDWACPCCGGKDYDSNSLCMDCGCRMISKEVMGMTNERAISMLEQIGRHECVWMVCRHNEVYKAIDMAIEALRKEEEDSNHFDDRDWDFL